MTLTEVAKLAKIPGKPSGWFTAGFPDIYKDHARKAWNGRARVAGIGDKLFIQSADGIQAPYALSFEDLIAEDWELFEDWECA